MKNTRAAYLLLVLFGVILISVLNSCKKEEISSRELLVFLQADIPGRATKTQTIPFVHTPVSILGPREISIVAYATREVTTDIDVYFEPIAGNTLIDEYNNLYGTTHIALPANTYRIVGGDRLRIQKGNLKSDSVKLEITAPEALTNAGGYLLPVRITKIESADKGARMSTTHSVLYYKFTYEFNNIVQTQLPLAGTNMSRTGWSVTVSNTTTGALGPAMLDGNNATSWRSSNSSTAEKWFILNMGTDQTVKGFVLVPNYVSMNENATKITVSSSTDNLVWTTQGTWNGTGPASTSSASAPDIKGINFVAPVLARYFRFDINTWVSGSRVGVGELNAVQ